MKNLFLGVVIAILGVSCSGNEGENTAEKERVAVETKITKKETILTEGFGKSIATLNIEGMTCKMGCAKRIENKLKDLKGVKDAKVDFEGKYATVEFDDKIVTEQVMIELIQEAGEYDVPTVEVEKIVVNS